MAAKQLEGHPGDRIGDLRTNLGMTKKELSRKTGIDASQITRIENGNLTIKMDNTEQRVSGGPLNDRLYHFLARKNQLDSQYMELSYEEMRMMMKGCSPEFIRAKLAPRAEELSKAIEDMETSFIVANYDNVLGPGIFIMLCNQYQYPILTQQMKYILKKAPSSFTDHPYIKRYVKIAKRNSKLLNHHD